MTSWAEMHRAIISRARDRCEYCQMHQSLQGATFHVEHAVPETHGGESSLENLAWACPRCNLCKSDRMHVIDPDTSQMVRLFNPRNDDWHKHFRFDDYEITPLSPVGRATIAALDLNNERRILIRQAEQMFGLFPPGAE